MSETSPSNLFCGLNSQKQRDVSDVTQWTCTKGRLEFGFGRIKYSINTAHWLTHSHTDCVWLCTLPVLDTPHCLTLSIVCKQYDKPYNFFSKAKTQVPISECLFLQRFHHKISLNIGTYLAKLIFVFSSLRYIWGVDEHVLMKRLGNFFQKCTI